jgi:DNA-binding LytR/AlgR family response regulator
VKIAYPSQPNPITCHQKTNNEQNIPFIEQSSVLIQEISPENTKITLEEIAKIYSPDTSFYDVNIHSRKSFQILKRIQIYDNLRIFTSCVRHACHLCLVTAICIERDVFVYKLYLGLWLLL